VWTHVLLILYLPNNVILKDLTVMYQIRSIIQINDRKKTNDFSSLIVQRIHLYVSIDSKRIIHDKVVHKIF